MTRPEVIKETPISLSELKSQLGKIKKRDEELNFRANKTEDYLAQFDVLSEAKAKELKGKIKGLDVPRLKEEHVIKIIDILPVSVDSIKTILQGYTLTISQDNMKKIVEVVKGYAK